MRFAPSNRSAIAVMLLLSVNNSRLRSIMESPSVSFR